MKLPEYIYATVYKLNGRIIDFNYSKREAYRYTHNSTRKQWNVYYKVVKYKLIGRKKFKTLLEG